MLLGIEIGGTKLQLVTGDANGKIIRRERCAVDRTRGGEGIREQIRAAIPKLSAGGRIEAVGVGFGGPVDWRTGKICCSHHVEGWSDFELGAWLHEITKAPVRIDNDANTACLGEATSGAGKGRNPVFYITMGSGVGGGLVVDGLIYHGIKPGESEIGHVRLDRKGTIVENRCSGWAVDRKIRAAILEEPKSLLAKLCAQESAGEARHLTEALKANDSLAQKILQETADDVAFALSHVVHLCHPEVIVLGGGLSLIGAPLQQSIQTALNTYIMEAFQPGPMVAIAALGEDTVPRGALLLAKRVK